MHNVHSVYVMAIYETGHFGEKWPLLVV